MRRRSLNFFWDTSVPRDIIIISVLCIIAHRSALAAIWYMDDAMGIVHSPLVYNGEWMQAGMRSLTYFTYWLTYSLFGMEGWAFHMGNLIIHLVFSLCVYRFAGDFATISGKPPPKHFALFAGLLFAVHPLTIEVTHYARARDHELVGIFSFLAAVFTLRLLKLGPRQLAPLVLILLLGALSKEQGLIQGVLSVLIVLLCYSNSATLRKLTNKVPLRFLVYTIVAAGFSAVILAPSTLVFWWHLVLRTLFNPDLPWHSLTQCRVVWEYIFRMFFPWDLCPDHQIAKTISGSDIGAWFTALGCLVLLALVVLLFWKGKRRASFILAMILAPMFLRFGYLIDTTLMVEYRTYPSMPWFAMGLSLILTSLPNPKFILRTLAAPLIILILILLSVRQGAFWNSRETLVARILEIYPTQLRAFLELNGYHLFINKPELVLNRSQDFSERANQWIAFNSSQTSRTLVGLKYFTVLHNLNIADALLAVKGPDAAMAVMPLVGAEIRATRFASSYPQGEWFLLMSKIEDAKGNSEAASQYRKLAQGYGGILIGDIRILQSEQEASPKKPSGHLENQTDD